MIAQRGSAALVPYSGDHAGGGERWLVSINPTAVARDVAIAGGATVVLSSDPALEGTTLGSALPTAAAVVARLT